MFHCARLVYRRQGGSTMLMSYSGPVASEENVIPFPSETLDDVLRNESCRLADQLLLKLAGSPRKSELTPVDPWRSVIAGAVRRRSLCGTTVRLEGRTVRTSATPSDARRPAVRRQPADNSLLPADVVPRHEWRDGNPTGIAGLRAADIDLRQPLSAARVDHLYRVKRCVTQTIEEVRREDQRVRARLRGLRVSSLPRGARP